VIGALSDGNIVRHNESFANDFGIQVVGGADNNVIFENHSHDNRRVGIRNIAGNGTAIENNRVFDNSVVGEFGGIFLSASTGMTLARNKAFNNLPLDMFWAGFGVNEFHNNHCRTSFPPGPCEHTEGASEKK
jgi:parallel beta-helix repeat protein